MGAIAIEGHPEAVGLLTEDASQAGIYNVAPTLTRPKTLGSIYEAFRAVNLETETLEHSIAFNVNDQERILDLAPSIFLFERKMPSKIPEYELLSERALDSRDPLTITIPADSRLANSILAKT